MSVMKLVAWLINVVLCLASRSSSPQIRLKVSIPSLMLQFRGSLRKIIYRQHSVWNASRAAALMCPLHWKIHPQSRCTCTLRRHDTASRLFIKFIKIMPLVDIHFDIFWNDCDFIRLMVSHIICSSLAKQIQPETNFIENSRCLETRSWLQSVQLVNSK